ncbi:MAG: DegV family protein [Oscillospiraceae bacterium]|nr:DegV family protein [Oscillospiraceae bacterium]
MCTYRILTDSCCDFPAQMYRQLELDYVPLSLEFRGEVTADRNDDSLKTLYDGMRAGEAARTSAVNPDTWAKAMELRLREGLDILVLTFSSGLSTTHQSAVIAAQEMMEAYPGRTVRVVDTLCASMGQGLLVHHVCRLRDSGASLEEAANWAEENKLHLCHWFTVDDLMHLKRGGRVSAATAMVGTLLQIKPVLHVDDEGHLINVSKARGRKASIEALAKKLAELGADYDNSTVFLSHGDCLEDARLLETILKEKYGVKQVVISYVGSVIGSHAGPGTLALFFLGKHR